MALWKNKLQELLPKIKKVLIKNQWLQRLTTDKPVVTKPYSVPFHYKVQLNKDISSMLEHGIIRRSDSPYTSPIVMVKKRDNSTRICVDFQRYNKISIFDPVPMTTSEDILENYPNQSILLEILHV